MGLLAKRKTIDRTILKYTLFFFIITCRLIHCHLHRYECIISSDLPQLRMFARIQQIECIMCSILMMECISFSSDSKKDLIAYLFMFG